MAAAAKAAATESGTMAARAAATATRRMEEAAKDGSMVALTAVSHRIRGESCGEFASASNSLSRISFVSYGRDQSGWSIAGN